MVFVKSTSTLILWSNSKPSIKLQLALIPLLQVVCLTMETVTSLKSSLTSSGSDSVWEFAAVKTTLRCAILLASSSWSAVFSLLGLLLVLVLSCGSADSFMLAGTLTLLPPAKLVPLWFSLLNSFLCFALCTVFACSLALAEVTKELARKCKDSSKEVVACFSEEVPPLVKFVT